MTTSYKFQAFLLASAFALTPSAAVAQNTASNAADANMTSMSNTDNMDTMGSTTALPVDTTANDMAYAPIAPPVREDKEFPWGLLGLLGLAGLLGRKRRDDDVVHVDRTDTTTDPFRTDRSGDTNNPR